MLSVFLQREIKSAECLEYQVRLVDKNIWLKISTIIQLVTIGETSHQS